MIPDFFHQASAQLKHRSGRKKGMPLANPRAWRARVALILTACLLAACSAVATSYNNAPTLITWWADRYFDLDADQETLLKERLRNLRAWHRSQQLPDYARLFAEVQVRMKGRIEPADVTWLYDEGEKRLRVLAERAAPQAAELATYLRAENIAALEKKLAENNAEYEKDYITAALDERQDKRYERVLKEAERWYGGFSREQKEKIRALSDALPANYPLVLEDRKQRQGELVAILRAASAKSIPQDETARRLTRWMTEYERNRSPAFRDFALRYRSEAQKMFAAIANLATAEQKVAADRSVQRYRDDFSNLAVAGN
jgi:hypothetical protein